MSSNKTVHRPDLPNAWLLSWVILLVAAVGVYLIVKPGLPDAFQRPGTALMQLLAAVGALLLLVPFAFSLGKRSGAAKVPNALFILHVGASLLGMLLVSLHAVAAFEGPPLFLVGFLALLAVTGVFARVFMAKKMAATFGSKTRPFTAPDAEIKAKLRKLIEEKRNLLRELDPDAQEALFSVTLTHYLKSPFKASAYALLARREAMLMGQRASVKVIQAWWRPVHIGLAWLFLAGLVVHVVVVTFFAGYVAEGREIYWWHLAAW